MHEQEVLVYADIAGRPVRVGRLFARARGKSQTASFAYDRSWLARPDSFQIDPELALREGPQHSAGKMLFGAFSDSAPDRWGRRLMQRAERRRAERADETPRTLLEIDYLLRVNDEARMAALCFALPDAPDVFQAPPQAERIPPLMDLASLLFAAEHVADDTDSAEELRLLVAPGSSLGGARPKASVRDVDGRLAIAKFPDNNDDYNAVLWEGVALSLAAAAGIAVPEWRIETVADKQVLLMTRFDRHGDERIPYQSAMSLLGAQDNEDHSYIEIADRLSRFGAQPKTDKQALWRRVVFNVLISNTDDHLRNHGFLHSDTLGWRLSPAFDMNPVPVDVKPRVLSTAIGIDEDEASLATALEYAGYYQLGQEQAHQIASEVGAAVSQWESHARSLGVSGSEIRRMASAFEHEDLEQALTARPPPGQKLRR